MKVIGLHSFRRGVGKSTLAANLAYLLAAAGKRTILMDVNLYSPALEIFFKLKRDLSAPTLNDYLSGASPITELVCQPIPDLPLHLVPASSRTADMISALRPPWDTTALLNGVAELDASLNPDYLLLDMASGLHEESILCMSVCNLILEVLRADAQSYQGTAIMVDVARRLQVEPRLVLNDAPLDLDLPVVRQRLEKAYDCPVAAMFTHSDQMMALSAVGGLFVRQNPDAEISQRLKELAASL